jgi:hypothetical protein
VLLTPIGVDFAEEVKEQQIAKEEELLVLQTNENTRDSVKEEELRIA